MRGGSSAHLRWGGLATSTQIRPSLSQMQPSTMRSEPPLATKPNATEPAQERLQHLECSQAISTSLLTDFELRLQDLQQQVEHGVEQRLSQVESDVVAATSRYRGMVALLEKRIHGLHQELGANATVAREQGIMMDDIRAFVDERLQSFSRIDNLRRELQGSTAKPDRAESNQDLEIVQQRLQTLESALSMSEQEHQAMTSDIHTMFDQRLQDLQHELAMRDSLIQNALDSFSRIDNLRQDLQGSAEEPDRAESNQDLEIVQQRLQTLESAFILSKQEHQSMTSDIHTMFDQRLQGLQQEWAVRDSLMDIVRQDLQDNVAKPDRTESNPDMEMVQQRLQKLECALSLCKQEHQAMTSEVFQELAVRNALVNNLTKSCEEHVAKAAATEQELAVQQRLQPLECTVPANQQEFRTMTSEVRAMFNQCLQSRQQESAMRDSPPQHALESMLSTNLNVVEEGEEREKQEDAAEPEKEEIEVAATRFRCIDRSKGPQSLGSISTSPGSPEESEASEGLSTPPLPPSSLRARDGRARGIREEDHGCAWRRVRFTVPESSPKSRRMEASPGMRPTPATAPRASPTQRICGAAAPPRGLGAPRPLLFRG